MSDTTSSRRPYTFDRVIRIIFFVVGTIAAVWLLNILRDVLLPFFVACLVAYLLEPLVKLNMRILHLKRRFLPVILTIIESLAVISLCCYFFIPYIVEECAQMAGIITRYASSQISIPYVSQQIHEFIRDNINLDEVSRWLTRDEWTKLIKHTLTSSWNFLSNSVAFIISVAAWLIVLLYLFFIMLDYDNLNGFFRSLVPVRHRKMVLKVFDDTKNAMNRYFRGQFTIAMIVGILFSIGFMIIGLPMAVVLGIFIGILNLVPYLQLISFPVTIVLCLVAYIATGVNFWTILIEALAVYVVVQLIQDMILTPKIMGKAMGLNPAIILLSLSVWGCLLGFIGLIIALPLTTLLLSYYNTYIVNQKSGSDRMPDNKPEQDPAAES